MTLAVSVVLTMPLLVAGWRASSVFMLNLTVVLMASVPAWSMIVGAVGASAQRKARYSIALLFYALAFDIVAFLTGWQTLATTASQVSGASSGVLISTYQLLLVSGPVVALVLFAGKRPSVFWETERDKRS